MVAPVIIAAAMGLPTLLGMVGTGVSIHSSIQAKKAKERVSVTKKIASPQNNTACCFFFFLQ